MFKHKIKCIIGTLKKKSAYNNSKINLELLAITTSSIIILASYYNDCLNNHLNNGYICSNEKPIDNKPLSSTE